MIFQHFKYLCSARAIMMVVHTMKFLYRTMMSFILFIAANQVALAFRSLISFDFVFHLPSATIQGTDVSLMRVTRVAGRFIRFQRVNRSFLIVLLGYVGSRRATITRFMDIIRSVPRSAVNIFYKF